MGYTRPVMEDLIIIGAGAVGAFIARSLSRYELSVLVIEKENDVGDVTSMANSAIAHSGYDPEPGTKKAIFNVAGNKMFPQLAKELDVNFGQVGTMYGHIHLPVLESKDGVTYLNPGSISFPKGGNPASFALLDENSLSILELDSLREMKKVVLSR